MADVWGLWNQNVSLKQLRQSTQVLCAAGKWADKDETIFASIPTHGKAGMVKEIWGWMDKADVIISYNGMRFDVPHLNREFLELGLSPPSPYKQIDLLKTSKSKFRFPSNKLDYIAQTLGIGKKVDHAGHQLWVDCMVGDMDAWEKMEEYNREDVILTEKLYYRFLPWISAHPNPALYKGVDEGSCSKCGSPRTIKRGFVYTKVGKLQRYRCESCGGWSQGRKNVAENKNLLTTIAGY